MKAKTQGFCLGLVVFSWGLMFYEIFTSHDLPIVAKNTGSCSKCGAATQVIIREKR